MDSTRLLVYVCLVHEKNLNAISVFLTIRSIKKTVAARLEAVYNRYMGLLLCIYMPHRLCLSAAADFTNPAPFLGSRILLKPKGETGTK